MIVILSTFLLGLSGGFGHCAGMCYPFVLYISSKFTSPSGGYAMLIPHIKYNLGRITTYTALGITIGFLGNLGIFNDYLIIQKSLTIAAGIILILFALSNSGIIHFKLPNLKLPGSAIATKSPYLTGVFLGFLPCGLIVAALITAAINTGPLIGGLSMAAFGLGTSAALMIMALFGGIFLKYIHAAKIIFTVLLIASGIYMIYSGIKLS